jgi:ABC-type transporter Mla MlaB component
MSSSCPVGVPDGDEVLDLRVHCPVAGVRIVRPMGLLTPVTVAPLLELMKVRLHQGPEEHFVLDLQDVRIDPAVGSLLAELQSAAEQGGSDLHVVGVDAAAIPGPGEVPRTESISAEELVERLARPSCGRRRRGRIAGATG